ncbi:DUF2339 domain-containing protein [Leptospira kmetyi]|uniref:DUF2339 domain-containing protein n=1 Tax=Leptospira kmetyi TaxID=408139 RepID=UPI001083DFAC|nr:DUF2339 domain-containing protein [Leptospira kmetyi]TGK16530.1 DUF2339 domain-containing protein [Leptospira kmetyi]TGK34067.1 DUF2339 domain-containing protein [Leptospira kmetyi]
METFFLFVLFLFGLYNFFQSREFKREIEELKLRIRLLESPQSKEKSKDAKGIYTEEKPIVPVVPSVETSSPISKEEKKPEKIVVKTESKSPIPAKSVTKESKKQNDPVSTTEPALRETAAFQKPEEPREPGFLVQLWKKVEKPLSENWTGILGAVILVAGIGFLGIYALFILSSVYRCLLILGFSIILAGLSFWSGRKPEFKNVSLVLRSSSAAVFLFTALGSGYVETLKWIENPYLALAVLSFGLSANLYTGYRSKNETFASLHTILALVSIAIPSATGFTLGVTALICLPGVIWNYREKRQLHLLIVSTGFFAAHLYWNRQVFAEAKPVGIEVLFPILCILPVFCGALLVHYRETLYGKREFELFPLASHLLNWSYLGISLIHYSQKTKISTIVLLLSAALVWFLSSRAKRKEISWLFLTDRLVSQSLLMLGIFSLRLWSLDSLAILAILALEILIFSWVCFREANRFLERISLSLTTIVFGTLIFFSYRQFFESANPGIAETSALTSQIGYGILILAFVGFIGILEKKFPIVREELSLTSLLITTMSLLAGGGLFSFYLFFSNESYGIWIPSILLSAILILRQKLSSTRLSFTVFLLAPLVTLTLWKSVAFGKFEEPERILALSLPWLLPFLVYLKNSNILKKDEAVYWPGILGFTAHLVFTFYYYLNLKGSLLFGPFAILLSLVYLELGKWARKRENKNSSQGGNLFASFYILSFVLTGIFLIRHFTVEFQSASILLGIPARFWIEILSASLFLYWILFPEEEFDSVSWLKSAQPLFWELLILIVVIGIYTETPERILSFVMAILTVIVFLLSKSKSLKTERFALYVYFFFIWTNLEIFLGGESTIFANQNQFAWKERGFQIASVFVQLGSIFFIFPRLSLEGLETYFIGWTGIWKTPLRFFQKFYNLLPGYLGIFGIVLSVYVYTRDVLNPISNLIVGPAWALLSISFLEIGQFFGRKKDSLSIGILSDFLKRASWLGLITFTVHYIYVDLQSYFIYLGFLSASNWTAILGIAVWMYWATSNIRETENVRFWQIVYPLLNEGCLLFLGLISYSLVNESWISVAFAVAALAVLEIGIRKTESLARFRWYGILFHLSSCFYLTFTVSTEDNPIGHWAEAKWIPGVLTILLLFLFVFRAYRGYGKEEIPFPTGLGFLKRISDKTGTYLNGVVYYPFFIGIFLFLYWSFSSAILTLLWSTLAFLIFLLGLFLKESWFRYLSLGLLLFCVGRLIFHDLSSSGTVLKAVVFLGVGSILLIMNTIYNKYRDRF